MTSPVIFTDLDDTLFQTARKCPNQSTFGLHLMSRLVDGSPSGYATKRQQSLLRWFQEGVVVPVTARDTATLARVDIKQNPAVASNGGCILGESGNFDLEWHSHLAKAAQNDAAINGVYAAMTDALEASSYRHWIISENGLPLYIVIKSNIDEGEILQELSQLHKSRDLLPDGWRVHINGNNLAYLPEWLNKRNAVTYLIDKIRATNPDAPIIGVGDSFSDVGFMDLCDFAMTPTSSQLWKSVTNENVWAN